MLIQIKFFFFFWLFPTIKLIATLENEKFDGIGWAAAKEKGGKFFDDPYLGAEKDADVYDTIENKLTEVGPSRKENPYKEMKKPLRQAVRQRHSSEHEFFEELATFNYGLIGMLKKRLFASDERREKQESLTSSSSSAEEEKILTGEGSHGVGNEPRTEDDIYGERSFFDDHLLADKGREDNLDAVGWFD